jgi:hypothetical protein
MMKCQLPLFIASTMKRDIQTSVWSSCCGISGMCSYAEVMGLATLFNPSRTEFVT